MPMSICTAWGCNRLVPRTQSRCDKHPWEKRKPKPRGTTKQRGYGTDSKKLRAVYIEMNPICEIQEYCDGDPAYDIDHIVPLRAGGERLDQNNLQSACRACHNWKTRTIDGPLIARYKKDDNL